MGAVIPIQVTFSEPVTVTGVPQLALNAGSSATAIYTGGNGSSTLTFSYTVASGQTTGDLDYTLTALTLDGGTIEDANGDAASVALPSTGSDGLSTQNIAVVSVSDGFESGDFSALPWQLSSSGASPANWTVQSSVAHSGSCAAESGAIGASSSSTLSVSLTEPAGEFAFWRSVSSASGSGILTFEIDGATVGQWSGTVPWQQAFYWVAGGTHTYAWVYAKDAGTPAGSDAAWLDDVQFLPGATLVVEGTSAADDQFSFDAKGTPLVVTFDGASQSFTTREFNKYVLLGEDGSASATLTGSASGDVALLYANGSGQLQDGAEGYAVSVHGMASIHVNGHEGETAEFFDSPGNDTFYTYADYQNSGEPMAEMLGSYGGGYANTAVGFGANVGNSTNGGSDTAYYYDSPGDDTFVAYDDNDGAPSAEMYGGYGSYGAYQNDGNGFATNVAYSTNGGKDTDYLEVDGLVDNGTYYAYTDYDNSGQPAAGIYGSYPGYGAYAISAIGFPENYGEFNKRRRWHVLSLRLDGQRRA